MSQHDMTIDTTFGQDIQDALQALASTAKGNSAPSTPSAGQLWLDDTATPWVLKMYDGTDWITVDEVDATTNLYSVKHEAGGLEFDASGVVDGDFIVGTGTGTMGLESGATLRTTVGVGTGDTPTFTGINWVTIISPTTRKVPGRRFLSARVSPARTPMRQMGKSATTLGSATDVLLTPMSF